MEKLELQANIGDRMTAREIKEELKFQDVLEEKRKDR